MSDQHLTDRQRTIRGIVITVGLILFCLGVLAATYTALAAVGGLL